ncbi:hypothetical protein Tco_1046556 [Tanacetum coccineum]
MSTPMFVDPDISTQADGAQSSRVPVPLPEDPYEAIRQAYLDGTDNMSCLGVKGTTRIAMRVPPTMSPGLFVSMAEVAAMSESAFRKRFRSSYESLPSSSPPDLPSRKRYLGMSELVEDEEDDEEEDEDIEESLYSDRDEGLAVGDEGPSRGVESRDSDDESRSLDYEGHSVESDRLGLEEEEETVPGGQQQAVPVVGTAVSAPLGLGFGSAPEPERPEWVLASRQPTLTTWTDLEDGMVYIDDPAYPSLGPPAQTPPLPEWLFGSLPISPSPFVVSSPISSFMISLTVPSPVASLATGKTERFFTELGAQVEMQKGLIRDHKRYRFRSLKHEHERVVVTFGAIWRPVLAPESWAGQTDAQRASLWHAISDVRGENWELRLQLAKERRARLELAEVVDSMRRGQEPRGDAKGI